MLRKMLKSKIHRATVTEANLDYEGSITIDIDLLKAADIHEYEMVQVVNLHSGDRFMTYAIVGESGSGDIALNGGAARKGTVGDKVLILSSIYRDEESIPNHHPSIIKVDSQNKII